MLQWDLDKRPMRTGKILKHWRTFFLPCDSEKIKVLLVRSMGFFMCFACPISCFQLKWLIYCTTYACLFSFTSSLQDVFSYTLKRRAQVEISFRAPLLKIASHFIPGACLTVPGREDNRVACDNQLTPVTFLKNRCWVSLSHGFPLVLSDIVNKQWMVLMTPCKFPQCPWRIPSIRS